MGERSAEIAINFHLKINGHNGRASARWLFTSVSLYDLKLIIIKTRNDYEARDF